jgi:hypothetical protein
MSARPGPGGNRVATSDESGWRTWGSALFATRRSGVRSSPGSTTRFRLRFPRQSRRCEKSLTRPLPKHSRPPFGSDLRMLGAPPPASSGAECCRRKPRGKRADPSASTTLPRSGPRVRIPSPAPKFPYISETIARVAAAAFGSYRQNETRRCAGNPGKIREVCSPAVLGP